MTSGNPSSPGPMDAARWKRLESVCAAALELPPAERASYLDVACVGDHALRLEADSMLRELDRDPGFLERPLVNLAAIGPEVALPAGVRIGAYRLIRPIGRGGMGEVYLAVRETEDIRQEVALKVIRMGMDTDDVLSRFRLERRILASLDHPNIARLLDAAATEDGRPYFVMEYVEGVPLDQYCTRAGLALDDRLRLFQVICGAVQHAHRNLVVHRDLKPRNILVTPDGIPKLLDFGIGKVLVPTEAIGPGVDTRTEVRLLTPEYAAPEQISGGPVTTATDVHGLGILLYELMAGRHPFASPDDSRSDIERAVLETDPVRPSEAALASRARRDLAGDLDTIVLKALRKEPERRYLSAADLAEDVQRYLDGLPVTARPDTLHYRVGKFIRRNTAWVAAATMALAALGATTVVTLVQSRRVARESERVAQERDKALEVRSFLMEMFGASGANRAADTVTVRSMLDLQAATVTEMYADRPELKATMQEVLADGYDRLGLFQVAEPLAEQALAIRRGVLPSGHPDLASSLNLVGWITHEQGRSKDAEPILREAIAIRRASGSRHRADLSRSLNDLGVVYNALGRYPEADSLFSEALTIRKEVLGPDHRAVGVTANNLAAAFYFQGKLPEAIEAQQLAVEILRKRVGPDHQRTAVAQGNLATFRAAGGDWVGAVREFREVLARHTRVQGRSHPVALRTMASLSIALYQLGLDGDPRALAEAEEISAEAVELAESAMGPTHPETGARLSRLAVARSARGKHAEAMQASTRALAILRPAQGNAIPALAAAHWHRGVILRRQGRLDEALPEMRSAIALLEQTSGLKGTDGPPILAEYCELLVNLGHLDEALGRCRSAEAIHRESLLRHRTSTAWIQLQIARIHHALADAGAADSMTGMARASLAAGLGNEQGRRLLDSITTRR